MATVVTLCCENCQGYYQLPKGWGKRVLGKVLYFAQCPHCGAFRNETAANFEGTRCIICNVPSVIVARGMCNADYMIWYRKFTISHE